MADVILDGRGKAASWSVDRVVAWALAHREVLAVASLMAIAAGLRFADLGAMALHHDESLHARYTWLLYDGQGYQHNPLMHGPFLFHSGSAVFFLFGDSDMTARFLPALFGTVLVGMPYLLRKQIGMPAVLIAAVLLTFSPTLLYYSRFYRNELYMAVWTVGIVICVWRYLDEQKDHYLYIMAALLAFSFASKEVTFITAAVLLVFLDLMFAVHLARRQDGEQISDLGVLLRALAIAPVAWVIAPIWKLIPPRSRPFGVQELPPSGDVLVLFGLLCLPQFSAAIQVLPFVNNYGYDAPEESTLRVLTVASLLLIMAYGGLIWRPKVFLIAAACFFVPYVLLYTTLFTNQPGPWQAAFWQGQGGFFSGIWGSLDYWLDQHHEKRGNQPGYYYAMLTPLYEFLPLVLALGGAAWLAVRGDSLRRWLVFWLFGIFLGLSIAGEKMPWLEVHIALPLIFMAALSLAQALVVFELTGRRWLTAGIVAAASAVAVLLLVEGDGATRIAGAGIALGLAGWLALCLVRDPPRALLSGIPEALSSLELQVTVLVAAGLAMVLSVAGSLGVLGLDAYPAIWAAAILPAALAGYLLAHLLHSSKAFGRGVLAIGVAALFVLTVRASMIASFENKDTPVEMMVYTQTSPDLPKIMDRIDAMAKASGLGYNLPVVIDDADSFTWPWAWYLRNYNEVSYANFNGNYQPPPNAVLLINRRNVLRIDPSAYTSTDYKHRWWFCESYRDYDANCLVEGALKPEDITRILSNTTRLEALGDFFLHRRPVSPQTIGSVDAVAFFPLSLSAFDVPADPRPPTQLADGRIVIGTGSGLGSNRPGELRQPADLFADAAGNLWIADGLNNRIQKFDSAGNFLGQIGRPGNLPDSLQEPWSVAVDAQGFVYVADTWNHRILKFSPELQLVDSWGGPRGAADPDPFELYGPRDIAIAPDGTLWVTDTGNNRLLRYSRDGEALDVGGTAPGGGVSYAEPVGLAFDGAGGLLVTDAWSGNLLRFGPDLTPSPPIAMGWTSKDNLAKPYLAVLRDGRTLVAVPESGQIVLLDSSGQRLGVWQPFPDSEPVGIAALADGGFAFSDVRRNEVQIVQAAQIPVLFK